jgi:hypothetical protein
MTPSRNKGRTCVKQRGRLQQDERLPVGGFEPHVLSARVLPLCVFHYVRHVLRHVFMPSTRLESVHTLLYSR